ncbi:hypothetical protein Pcinc_008469 [Petrolisthes cinctipes]|uniref:Uncharacterized protein n=1 Tax=Petrolisthes cinctipes TaxID=88211 RepID=A0AAE1KWE7_PETCI|nr:hypothetical protein Pcinc_008469 [Petrolisthes cinctipes]
MSPSQPNSLTSSLSTMGPSSSTSPIIKTSAPPKDTTTTITATTTPSVPKSLPLTSKASPAVSFPPHSSPASSISITPPTPKSLSLSSPSQSIPSPSSFSIASPSVTSLEDELGPLASLPTFNMSPGRYPRRLGASINSPSHSSSPNAPMSLPTTLQTPSYTQFPRYKRQYKVESIYVNDLYTLTYDEGETLESIKSVVVNYKRRQS